MSNQFLRASQEAIARNGVLVTYKKKGASTYDPASGTHIMADPAVVTDNAGNVVTVGN
jgi:hypothetical protein